MSSELNELINRIAKLDINQQRILRELVDELVEDTATPDTEERDSTIAPNTGVRKQKRIPNHNFISKNGIPLAIGDRVEITTTRKVGRAGDIAQIVQFNQKYIALTILASSKATQRAGKYVNFLE